MQNGPTRSDDLNPPLISHPQSLPISVIVVVPVVVLKCRCILFISGFANECITSVIWIVRRVCIVGLPACLFKMFFFSFQIRLSTNKSGRLTDYFNKSTEDKAWMTLLEQVVIVAV